MRVIKHVMLIVKRSDGICGEVSSNSMIVAVSFVICTLLKMSKFLNIPQFAPES
jgi:hypothetical protein